MSRQTRNSAMTPMMPWRGAYVDASEAGTTQGNRQAAAWLYSGILAGVATSTDSIITRGSTPPARQTICDQMLIMVGQAHGSTTTRTHSAAVVCGRSLGLGLRLGQATGSGTTRSHSSSKVTGRTLGLDRRLGQP